MADYGDQVNSGDWETVLNDLLTEVRRYRNEVTTKINQVLPTVRMTEFERETIRLQQLTLAENKEKRIQKEKIKMEEGLAQTEAKLMAFKEDYENLTAELDADPCGMEEYLY